MKVAKWGNSLAVRLPAALVRELGLKEGAQIDLLKDGGRLSLRRQPRPEEVLVELRRFRGRLPESQRLNREDANDRKRRLIG